MPVRPATPTLLRRLGAVRRHAAVAGLCGLAALTGPLADTVANASNTAAARDASSGSPAAISSGPTLVPARAAQLSPRRGSRATSACPWLNQSLPITKRVNMLMSHMSLTDKIAEMYIYEGRPDGPYAGYEGFVPAQPALCIPDLVEQDGPLGVAYGATGVTQLPAEVSLGSAWDPIARLSVRRGQRSGAPREGHRDGAWALGQHPARPPLGAQLRDVQRGPVPDLRARHGQHRGSPEPACDGRRQALRHLQPGDVPRTPNDDTIVNKRALHEIYLPPFYSAIEQAHAASIMCAYPLLNGQYSCQNASLLTGLLDDRWALSGIRPLRQRRQRLDRRFR